MTDLAPNPGAHVGQYRLEALIGEGGMGKVYRAQAPDGSLVALKLLRPEPASDETQRRRFRREVKAAQAVEHPHVVGVLESGEYAGSFYIVQDLVRGGSLADRIELKGALSEEETVRLALDVAAGLDAIHQTGIIHRDVKPANIFVSQEGRARVGDFGLSKDRDASALTRPGLTVGTLSYMAPERIRAQNHGELTPAADVYSMGCVAFECLTGAPPFAEMKGLQVLWGHLRHDPPDPSEHHAGISPDLGEALRRALEKDPARRPATAGAYARMLEVAVAGPAPGAEAE